MKILLQLIMCLYSFGVFGQNQDSLKVVSTTEKYIQSFYQGEPEWLKEVLHPELIKRTLKSFPNSGKFIATSGKTEMVELSKVFNRQGRFNSKSKVEVIILDIFKEMATVRLTASKWVDYLHLVKVNGKWQIINIVWLIN